VGGGRVEVGGLPGGVGGFVGGAGVGGGLAGFPWGGGGGGGGDLWGCGAGGGRGGGGGCGVSQQVWILPHAFSLSRRAATEKSGGYFLQVFDKLNVALPFSVPSPP